MSHTPGPWITESTVQTPNGLDEIIKNSSGTWVGWVYRPTDAALIAAAPEMLEMLKRVLEQDEMYFPDNPIVKEINRVIAQAGGGEE